MNNAEKFKQIFGLYATELWSMPESDFLEWLNRDVETAQIDHTADIGKKVSISCGQENDMVSRQAALDAIMGQPPEPHYPSWYAAQIEKLPAVQPATNCSEIPNGSDDTISRRAAIDAIEHITTSMSVCVNTDECHGMKRMQRQAVLEIANMPAVQPDRDVIDDCLYHIHKNISTHTATGGVIAIRYYMEKLYEEIYGKGERPWWMT